MIARTDPYAAEDLAAAPPKAAERLREADDELAKREAALRAAEDQREAAKQAVLAAGMSGRDDSKAAAALASAAAAVDQARQLRDLRREVADTIRAEVLAEVRAGRAAAVEAKLASVREQYDDQVRLYAEVVKIADNLEALARAEAALARELAEARRDGFHDTLHGYVPGSGSRYRTIPDERVGFHLIVNGTREDVASPGHLVDRLRRREG